MQIPIKTSKNWLKELKRKVTSRTMRRKKALVLLSPKYGPQKRTHWRKYRKKSML